MKTSILSTAVTLMIVLQSEVTLAESCAKNLSYLEPKLRPNYQEPSIQIVRDAILHTDIAAEYQKQKNNGHSPSQVAAAALDKAKEYEAMVPNAEAGIRAVAVDPDMIIQQLRSGTYVFGNGAGMLDAYAGEYIRAYWGALAMREGAIGIACMAAAESGSASNSSNSGQKPSSNSNVANQVEDDPLNPWANLK